MNAEFIELIKDFLIYNKYHSHRVTLKEYLITELNYNEEDADEINRLYNLKMGYS